MRRRRGVGAAVGLKKKVLIAGGVVALVCGAAAVFFAVKLRDDPAVLDDIDRHFESLRRYAPTADDYRSVLANEAGEGTGTRWRSTRVVKGSGSRPAETRGGSAKGEGSKAARRVGASSSPEAAPALEGVRELGQGTYALDEDLVDAARANPRGFTGRARARIVGKGGEPVGFEVGGIGVGSPLHAIGIRDGDVITAVNGHSLKSLDEVLLAAAAVRSSDRFRVDILRGGAKRSLYYLVE